MKRKTLNLLLFFTTAIVFQKSAAMDMRTPSHPQRVNQLVNDVDQDTMMMRIQETINTIKLIITQSGRFATLQALMGMGYSIDQIATACSQLGNIGARIKTEIIAEKQRRKAEQQRIIEQRQQDVLRLAQNDRESVLGKRKRPLRETNGDLQEKKKRKINNENVQTIVALMQEERSTSSNRLKTETLLKRYRFMGFADKEIMQAIIVLRQAQDEREEKPEKKNPAPQINKPVREAKNPKRNIQILTTIISAMKNPNAMLNLAINRRIGFESPQNLNVSKLLQHNFAEEDIIAACKQIGLENIPASLKKELFG